MRGEWDLFEDGPMPAAIFDLAFPSCPAALSETELPIFPPDRLPPAEIADSEDVDLQ